MNIKPISYKLLTPILSLLLTACTTNPVTGSKRVFGLIPLPFTKAPVIIQDDKLAILVQQLEKFSWIGIFLIIGGGFWWRLSGGCTGLGKTSVIIGSIFITLAFWLPQIAGYVTMVTVIAIVLALTYAAWHWVFKKKEEQKS